MLVTDVDELHFGEVVRVPKRKTWWVVCGRTDVAPDSVRVKRERERGKLTLEIQCDVTFEAMARAEFDEWSEPVYNVSLWAPVHWQAAIKTPPFERVLDPVPIFWDSPPTPVIAALLAYYLCAPEPRERRELFKGNLLHSLRDAGARHLDCDA